MSEERERKKTVIHQSWGVMTEAYGRHGFKPQGTADNIEEIQKRVKTEKDSRMVTGYLLARDTIRNLQKLKEEIEESGYIDIEKEDKVNRAIRKILRVK